MRTRRRRHESKSNTSRTNPTAMANKTTPVVIRTVCSSRSLCEGMPRLYGRVSITKSSAACPEWPQRIPLAAGRDLAASPPWGPVRLRSASTTMGHLVDSWGRDVVVPHDTRTAPCQVDEQRHDSQDRCNERQTFSHTRDRPSSRVTPDGGRACAQRIPDEIIARPNATATRRCRDRGMVGWPQRDGHRGCERDKTKANFRVM
jgi:hypothetical protein